MPKIKKVEPMGSDVLSVDLDNGHTLILPIPPLLSLPKFAALAEDDRIFYPHTDGECVYWNVHPKISMSLDEMITLLDKLPGNQ